jgi:acyl carrier protein
LRIYQYVIDLFVLKIMENQQKVNEQLKINFQQIQVYIRESFQIMPDKICLCSNLNDDLNLEIWEKVELIIFLEINYNVKFPDDATSRYQSIFELIAYIIFDSYYFKTPPF